MAPAAQPHPVNNRENWLKGMVRKVLKQSSGGKNALLIERLCETFAALYQGTVIDKNWLCERFAVTERTAWRDLARLGHLLEEVSVGRYRLSQHLMPALHVGQLAEFARFAGVSHLFPHHDGKSLRQRMSRPQNLTIQGAVSRDNRALDDVIATLDGAISAAAVVTFTYRQKPRVVQPYRLINHLGLWYLAGVEDGALKAFELARITGLAQSAATFSVDSAVTEQLNSTPGIRFGTPDPVSLWVSAHAAQYVTRRPLFPGQQVTATHLDGSLTLSAAVNDKHTLFRWLRYWLPDIRILAPAVLQAEFAADFRQRSQQAEDNHPRSTSYPDV